MKRVKVLFKIKNEVVVEESGDLTLTDIEKFKWVVVEECEANYDDIDVEIIELPLELGDIDVGSTGMYNYKDSYFNIKVGVKFTLIEGSNEHLEAISNGTIEDYLIFV